MEESLVSIIIPCYELEPQDVVYNTLDSIVRSKGFDRYVKEIVPVVNGDNTLRMCDVKNTIKDVIQGEKYEGLVKIIESEKGVSKARNAGARVAQGDILIFCDCDVTIPQRLIESIVTNSVLYANNRPQVKDVVGVALTYFRREGTCIGIHLWLNTNKTFKNIYNFFPFHLKIFDKPRRFINDTIYKLNLKIEKNMRKFDEMRAKKDMGNEPQYMGLPIYLPRKFAGTGLIFCSRTVYEKVGGYPEHKDCFEDREFLEVAIDVGGAFVLIPQMVLTSDRRYVAEPVKKIMSWTKRFYNDFMSKKNNVYNHALE
jgi:glycosyltransferase involved in cell wall biosynthesis